MVSWQPLTLIEARGFIEYIIELNVDFSLKRQAPLTMRVPMNQSSVAFTGLDPNLAYEVTVGTETPSIGMQGPTSDRIVIQVIGITPPSSEGSSTTTIAIIIAISVVFLITVLIIAVVVVILNCSRRSSHELTKDLR